MPEASSRSRDPAVPPAAPPPMPRLAPTPFRLVSDFAAGRRPAHGHRGAGRGRRRGATGSRPCSASPGRGKSATIAWTIEQVQRPTLVIAPNKSLAAQLANEFREFFPDNRVEYFV